MSFVWHAETGMYGEVSAEAVHAVHLMIDELTQSPEFSMKPVRELRRKLEEGELGTVDAHVVVRAKELEEDLDLTLDDADADREWG